MDLDDPAFAALSEQATLELPGGYCSTEPSCATDSDCGLGGTCFFPLEHSSQSVMTSAGSVVEPASLDRQCTSVATGSVIGATLSWGTCDADGMSATDWSYDDAQTSSDAGCATPFTVLGSASCSGSFCSLACGVGDQVAACDQLLSPFVFDGSDFTTAGFTMAETQLPDPCEDNRTVWMAITEAVPSTAAVCADAVDMTCP